MKFDEMAEIMSKPGITIRKYCGIAVDENIMCDGEAVGELTAQLDDGTVVPIPICETHLKLVTSRYDVESLSLDSGNMN
jgi:hypothetical protein